MSYATQIRGEIQALERAVADQLGAIETFLRDQQDNIRTVHTVLDGSASGLDRKMVSALAGGEHAMKSARGELLVAAQALKQVATRL